MDSQILFVFKVGHSVYRKKIPEPNKTHHWRFFIESWSKRYPLSAFVDSVVVQLHRTFNNPKRVLTKEPFVVEEDGFGNFCLMAKISFLNVFTDISYDITLFDRNELQAFRTVRLLPKTNEECIRYTNIGGIPIPASATSADIQQTVLEQIQSPFKSSSLTGSSFYPELAASVVESGVPHSWQRHASPSCSRSRLNREARSQALVNLGAVSSTASLVGSASTTLSSGVSASTPLPPLSIKHKKKLQLKHEAQLLWENQHHSEASESPPPSPLPAKRSPQPKGRIVLKLSRSDLKKKKKSEDKKRRKRHRYHQLDIPPPTETSSDAYSLYNSPVLQRGSPGTSSCALPNAAVGGLCEQRKDPPLSLAPPLSRSPDVLNRPAPSPSLRSNSLAALNGQADNGDSSSDDENCHKNLHDTPCDSSPGVDTQQATMVWISHLNGGPQPLVSPLPPHHSNGSSPVPHQLPSNQPPPPPFHDKVTYTATAAKSKKYPKGFSRQTYDAQSNPRPSSTSRRCQAFNKDKASARSTRNMNGETADSDCGSGHSSSMSMDDGKETQGGSSARYRRMENGLGSRKPHLDTHQESRSLRSGLSSDSTPPMSVEALPPSECPVISSANSSSFSRSAADGALLDNATLERLYDRILNLQHESTAIRMAQVLKRYAGGEESGAEVLTPSWAPADSPGLIAFDLRKLPIDCVVQIAEIIATDGQLTSKRETEAPSLLQPPSGK